MWPGTDQYQSRVPARASPTLRSRRWYRSMMVVSKEDPPEFCCLERDVPGYGGEIAAEVAAAVALALLIALVPGQLGQLLRLSPQEFD